MSAILLGKIEIQSCSYDNRNCQTCNSVALFVLPLKQNTTARCLHSWTGNSRRVMSDVKWNGMWRESYDLNNAVF